MSIQLKAVLYLTMVSALFFGFLHHFVEGAEMFNFERLHIFLFNLCSGGTILIYYTERHKRLSPKAIFFYFGAIAYAVTAFLEWYAAAIPLAIILSVTVETVRIKRFGLFPLDFFRKSVKVAEKFHQASLLCLSIGLSMSGLVIINEVYLQIITTLPKLKLDTFFLGFSFPLSLITLSVMFSLMKADIDTLTRILKNIGFWAINLGVITFFIFILFELLIPQVIVTMILFAAVAMIFFLYYQMGRSVQQKQFLSSGMCFLLYTAVTGIAYIILAFFPAYYNTGLAKFILKMHAFASLYGWNLSGLAVICRYNDFPIKLHSRGIILLHWITAAVLAPIGVYSKPVAISALLGYMVILAAILFTGHFQAEKTAGSGRVTVNAG